LTSPTFDVLVLFMSIPAEMVERHGRILAELSELGLALAHKLQGEAMAAETPEAAAELGRAFHSVARTVRQTLALEAKMERERRAEARWERVHPEPLPPEEARQARRLERRRERVQEPVTSAIWHEHEDDEEARDDLIDRLVLRMDELRASGELDTRPALELIERLCADLGLDPESCWDRSEEDYDDEDDAAYPAPPPTLRANGFHPP
jgi:hypothetical protein